MTGLELIRIRQRLNLTQAQLAEKLGIFQGNLSRYESGRDKIPKYIEKLIDYLKREYE